MRGRKKKLDPLNETISIRITAAQKEIINKNKWIKKEIDDYTRKYLSSFIQQ